MNEKKIKSFLTLSGAVLLFAFCTAPFFWMGLISLVKHPDFLTSGAPFNITIENYTQVINDKSIHLFDYLRNSIIISLITALITTIITGLSAYSITRIKFPGRVVIPLALLGLSIFPQISIVGYLFKIMTALGWINSYPALIFPYITLGIPLALWILINQFSRVPKDLDEAATIDGATRLQIFIKIIFPVTLIGFFTSFILVFILAFNEFLYALMLTTDYRSRTIPVGIALFEGLHGQIPWGYIMAAAILFILPVILIIAFFQKYIIKGITEGSVTG